MMNNPELLAPAGGMRQLQAALRFGADAVYLGLQSYSLREHAGNFTADGLREAVRYAHARGKRVYVALNMLPADAELPGLLAAAREALAAGADAAIVADVGVVAMLRARLPELPLHLSTQANTLNSEAAVFWHAQGVARVVLGREMTLAQIVAMRAAVPQTLALEAFVHGAMCVSYSGRCLLSAALTGRSANRGACAQPCRWTYTLVEAGRRDQPLTATEEAGGTALLSAGDLCMLDHLPALCAAGLASLKIEGRMKGEYYVATVVGAYRRALDACAANPAAYALDVPLRAALRAELEKASHRRFDTGFYFGAPERPGQAEGYAQRAEYVGDVLARADGAPQALVEVKNRFFAGDALEAMTPRGPVPFTLRRIVLADTGQEVPSIPRPGTRVLLDVPEGVAAGDLLRGPCRNHAGA